MSESDLAEMQSGDLCKVDDVLVIVLAQNCLLCSREQQVELVILQIGVTVTFKKHNVLFCAE